MYKQMYKLNVPYINQSEQYPTGCESVSATMLLQYLGYAITVDAFIEDNLEKREMELREGVLYGPDPYQYFAGSPYDPDSFGCYAPVIGKAVKQIVGDAYQVTDETGKSIPELIATYIDAGMPVILWACINMREPIVGPKWNRLDTEEEFTWISNEHCMLLVGYDDKNYYVNDPYENKGTVGYDKKILENRHKAQHMQAIALKPMR